MRVSLTAAALLFVATATAQADPIIVNTDNFIRAETDLYFKGMAAIGGFGKLNHNREMAKMDEQTIIRLNRDTLYSAGVFDLDAGPVQITIPDAGERFISMQVIDQNHYTNGVFYGGGTYDFTRESVGTRYVALAIRTLANPDDPADLDAVHALQDGMIVTQDAPGVFEIPEWDAESQAKTRDTLNILASALPDTSKMFGSPTEVDPVRHILGTAFGWGGNPDRDAMYINRYEPKNDGKTVYRLKVADVPVKSFWSISVYNGAGFYEPNDLNAYNLNSVIATPGDDGNITVQFGGCDGEIPNCLPISEGWNWMVRLYQPEENILSGDWSFPQAEEVKQ